MNEYRITDDGFGIHTFELSISHLCKDKLDAITERIFNEQSNRNYVKKHKSFCIHTKYPCLRIYLNQKKNKRYIRIIVTANKILYPESDYLSILNENENISLLEIKLNEMLSDIFGDEYDLDSFSLSRIDCCVNVMLSRSFSAERYVKLISRSLVCKRYMIEEYDGNDELSKNRNKHSFRVRTNFGAFTAYDKYFQLEDINVDFDTISDALLRLELEYDRNHIRSTIKDNDAEIHNNAEVLAYYLRSSRRSFEAYIYSSFHKGCYYTVKKMRELIETSDLKKCEKKHANKHIESQCYSDHYQNALANTKKILKSEKAFYNMLANFEYLDISPISLSYRDKHGDDSVPCLYELLGFNSENSL